MKTANMSVFCIKLKPYFFQILMISKNSDILRKENSSLGVTSTLHTIMLDTDTNSAVSSESSFKEQPLVG